jgi:thiopeptide-type bacteriocin biosynthesis protein
VKRKFIVGEEWLYIKLFSGPVMLEQILSHEIYDWVQQLYAAKQIDKFFFVRYREDGYHLRLRFHLTDTLLTGPLLHELRRLLQPYTDNRVVWQVTADTYDRELERYGPLSMEAAETLFSVSSLAIMEILRNTPDYTQRWLQGISIMDSMLNSLIPGLQEKYRLHESYYQQYAIEFNTGKQAIDRLKEIYRTHSRAIADIITAHAHRTLPEMSEAANTLLQLQQEGRLEVPLHDFLRSILHMHYNRLFRVKQRRHEYVVYYMLSNFYKSWSIRIEKSVPVQHK